VNVANLTRAAPKIHSTTFGGVVAQSVALSFVTGGARIRILYASVTTRVRNGMCVLVSILVGNRLLDFWHVTINALCAGAARRAAGWKGNAVGVARGVDADELPFHRQFLNFLTLTLGRISFSRHAKQELCECRWLANE
jgi:hypothetical protein